jgi:hypothetical protein
LLATANEVRSANKSFVSILKPISPIAFKLGTNPLGGVKNVSPPKIADEFAS